SYQRYGEGRMIQTGILADKVAKLYAQLDEQAIIDQIIGEKPLIQIAFINHKNMVTASSVPSEIGQRVDETTLAYAIEEGPTHLKYVDRKFDWYLKLYIPIQVNDTPMGTLSLLFDLTNTNKLFFQVAMTITAVLLLLFILFSFTIIHIARKNKYIFRVAYYDEVTHLPNINCLKRVLEEQAQKNLALIIINPLHFKFINLIYGYNYGDTLLHQIAQHLSGISLKTADLEVYRFTDDQFILTVKNYDSQETLYSLCNLILSINEWSGALGTVDLTIGAVEWKQGKPDFDTIIKQASIALNATHETNRIQFYTVEIEELILRKDAIENELKRIVAGKTGILHLAYQPIVNAKDGSIVSFEALARMQSSTLGRVPPLEFITIAEERHLIIPLGKIILEQAAAFMKRLTDLGCGSYPIGVNVSALQLLDETFVTSFQDITHMAGIEPRQLEIELTESVFSTNFEFLSQQIEAIHALGVRIAIDDFGTGFSSLNRLEGLVVDTLKLDKQFVDKLIDPTASKISSDIVSMVHHLGKRIIAEGVETEDQRQQLLDMNCDYMQGYLFSRPVGEEEVIRLLQEQGSGTRQTHHHE
ncbi:MAG TPA: bifunctional diguanylate cyclase/phosphodiesterase, partial [Sphaerochaeta sp.]|nr:bifunctional diguanylate cyclase/phosphodiesterase [Sphaerochaeta sp.]